MSGVMCHVSHCSALCIGMMRTEAENVSTRGASQEGWVSAHLRCRLVADSVVRHSNEIT